MSSASTRYTARFQLPDLLERGADQIIWCPVYRSGALVAPTTGTVTVRSRTATVVDAAAATISGSIARYTIPAASLPSTLSFETGWSVEWLLDMPDGETHRFRNGAALVRARLYPTITDADLIRRVRALDPSLTSVLTTQTHYQDQIDEADVEVQLRLLADDRRPNLIADPTSLRQVWLDLTIAIIFEDLAAHDNHYAEVATMWRQRYGAAYDQATLLLDYDEDGQVDDPSTREPVRDAVIWTC